jgi:hypothetical protein
MLDFGRVAPGHTATSTVQVHPPSDAVVTAAIEQDAAGIFTVRQIVAYDVVPEAVDPRDPRAPANTPVVGVPHRRRAADGRTPLAVRAGQVVAVEVEVAPVAGGEDILKRCAGDSGHRLGAHPQVAPCGRRGSGG